MRRFHLIEFDVLHRLSRPLRGGVTDFLEVAGAQRPLFGPAAPRLLAAIGRSRRQQEINYCSRHGGAGLRLLRQFLDSGCSWFIGLQHRPKLPIGVTYVTGTPGGGDRR